MITSPTGTQRVTVHGLGPQNEVMSVAQFRDAAGYSKQSPEPKRTVTVPGIVKLVGSTVAINTTGIVDGSAIRGLAATDGLIGAGVASAGIPDGTTVKAVIVAAIPGAPGSVMLSNFAPFGQANVQPQPVVFSLVVRRNTISGLASTDGLTGAKVTGGGLPDGATVAGIRSDAIAATNTQAGVPGEVLLSLPAQPPKIAPVPPAVAPQVPGNPAPETSPVPAYVPAPVVPAEPVPLPAVNIDPVDVTFDIPTQPIPIPDGVSRLILSPTDALEALTVRLPEHPVDGQEAFIFSTLAIAELTVVAHANQILNWSPPAPKAEVDPNNPASVPKQPFLALDACAGVGYLYSTPNTTWDRIQ